MTRVEFWPSRSFLVISIGVWSGMTALVVWGIMGLDWLGPDGRLIAAVLIGGGLAFLGAVHVWGSQLSGPTLVADQDGMIFRDGRKVWGPIPWGAIAHIERGEGRDTLAIWVHGAVKFRSVIGLRWVVEDQHAEPGVLWIEPHIIDNRADEAYVVLTQLQQEARP